VTHKDQGSRLRVRLILGAIWLVGALCDRIWIALDHSVPSWDPTNHLTGSLNYLNALQHSQWFSPEWWQSLWKLSSKYPPLTYIATAPFQQIFGTGPDQALLVNLLFTAVLLAAVYGLGKHLFNTQTGLLAAGLCLLFPRLYIVRINYLTDYPLTALVAASFWCLTVWRDTKTWWQGWRWALGFGFCFGLAILTKQTALLFLIVPLLWTLIPIIWQRAWGRLAQLIGGLLLSGFIFGPWYRTNWIFLFSTYQNAMIVPAMEEHDPPLNTLAAWIYYWNDIPGAISWPLLLVSLVGLLLVSRHWFYRFINTIRAKLTADKEQKINAPRRTASKFLWLAVFFVASYLFNSANINKNERYIIPYLPVLSVVLAYGLSSLPKRWQAVRWGTVGLALLLMCLNLFPIGGKPGAYFAQVLSPNAQHYPYRGPEWPHPQVIEEIIRTEPQLKATVGVLPRIGEINHNNVNYYGALKNFQVYGREVGIRQRQVTQDMRSLSWFLSKTGNQGTHQDAENLMVQAIEKNPDFQVPKNWHLPDGSILKLYHRTSAPIQVQPLQSTQTQVSLAQVTVPPQAPPGVPVPITYEWTGPWEQLQSGIVLLTWKGDKIQESQLKTSRWLHDHGIAMGKLHSGRLSSQQVQGNFRVIEQTAMLPPGDVTAGTYTLEATYLNRKTGENYPISVPPVTLNILPNAPATPAPELDLVTQLRTLAASLPKGREALNHIFDEIGRINQYDPVQDYTTQAELALGYRLQQEPQNRDWAYGLAFSQVLHKDAVSAIATLKRVVQLDSQNPYPYAYLAFLYLYQWRGYDAQEALKPALTLNPNIPEIQGLSGAAALFQGNVFQAWHILEKLKH